MSDNVEARIDRLESLVAEQDRTIEDLNGALMEQFKQIEALKHELARFGAQLEDIESHPALANAPEPPPPHY